MRKVVLIALFLMFPSTALADVELNVFAGYRFGGATADPRMFCVFDGCFSLRVPEEEARDSSTRGLVVDVTLKGPWMFELLISDQSTEFGLELTRFYDVLIREEQGVDLTHFHVGILRQWENPRATPFIGIGVGIAELESPGRFILVPDSDKDRLSASLAFGVKIAFNKWLGARIEGRGYWTDMPERFTQDLFQVELNSGLFIRL
ncbi:MAG: hypothetical protein AAF657_01280 [Acidobacteriota bacterium]